MAFANPALQHKVDALIAGKNLLIKAKILFEKKEVFQGATELTLAKDNLAKAGMPLHIKVEQMHKEAMAILGLLNENQKADALAALEKFKSNYTNFLFKEFMPKYRKLMPT